MEVPEGLHQKGLRPLNITVWWSLFASTTKQEAEQHMSVIGTTSSNEVWGTQRTIIAATSFIPDALILRATTLISSEILGDASVINVPWVDDATAVIVPEGQDIPDAEATTKQATIRTCKVANLVSVSNELVNQATGSSVMDSFEKALGRAIVRKADEVFLSQAKPDEGDVWPPEGILSQITALTTPKITNNLDALVEGIGMAEAAGATPELLLVHPTTWATLRKLKDTETSNRSLIGSVTEDADKRLLGLNVVVNKSMPVGKVAIIDPSSIAAVCSPIDYSISDHAKFAQDARLARYTFRFGSAVMNADRNILVTVE